MVFYCCIRDCKNSSLNQPMHILPIDIQRFKIWIRAIGREDIEYAKRKSYCVCDIHFSNDMKFVAYKNKTHLLSDSIPNLYLPGVDVATVEDFPSTSGSSSFITSGYTVLNALYLFIVATTSDTEEPPAKILKTSLIQKQCNLSVGSRKKRVNFLKMIDMSRRTITPRKEKLVNVARSLMKTARQLYKQKSSAKQRTKAAYKVCLSPEYLRTYLNKPTVNLFLTQLKMQKIKPKGRRFSVDDKIFALGLLKQSPKAYRLLRTYFALPSRRTLLNVLQSVPLTCGINSHVFKSLQNEVAKLKPLDKYCTLIFDEMSLEANLTYKKHEDLIEGFHNCGDEIKKQFASHALVFMVKGIRRKWKQPIAYYFSDTGMPAVDLVRNLKQIITEVQNTGLHVIATVCDQSATNSSAIKMLLEETKRNFIQTNREYRLCGFEVNGIEVVPLFDAPHLLKGLRNNLIDAKVKFSGKKQNQIASWMDIVHLYEMDVRDEVKVCYKLTEEHINSRKMKKMKVKHAAQVLSHTVSAGIRSNVKWGQGKLLPQQALDTADFAEFVDMLFDSVNGSTIRDTYGKPLKCALSSTSGHLAFWNEALRVLNTMHFQKGNSVVVPPTVKNWGVTIRGFKYIWEKLHNAGFEYLCLRNLNQDALENFFGGIRSHGYRNINPSCTAFSNSFKTLLINNFMTPHSVGSNCEEDDHDGALTSLKHFFTDRFVSQEEVEEIRYFEDADEDFAFSEQAPTNMLQIHSYVAGYVARKTLQCIGKCKDCQTQLLTMKNENHHIYINLKTYTNKSLLKPNTVYLKVFSDCMQVLRYFLPRICEKAHIKQVLISKLIKYVPHTFTCDKHNLFSIIITKLIPFYIHTWCKNVNRIMKGVENRNINDDIQKLAVLRYNKYKKR